MNMCILSCFYCIYLQPLNQHLSMHFSLYCFSGQPGYNAVPSCSHLSWLNWQNSNTFHIIYMFHWWYMKGAYTKVFTSTCNHAHQRSIVLRADIYSPCYSSIPHVFSCVCLDAFLRQISSGIHCMNMDGHLKPEETSYWKWYVQIH